MANLEEVFCVRSEGGAEEEVVQAAVLRRAVVGEEEEVLDIVVRPNVEQLLWKRRGEGGGREGEGGGGRGREGEGGGKKEVRERCTRLGVPGVASPSHLLTPHNSNSNHLSDALCHHSTDGSGSLPHTIPPPLHTLPHILHHTLTPLQLLHQLFDRLEVRGQYWTDHKRTEGRWEVRV